MIRSFAEKATERVWQGLYAKKLPRDIQIMAQRRLSLIDAADAVEDLRVPPGNMLEPLKGDRKGQWSIRINRQWRICFKWVNGNAEEVEICDYH